MKAANYAASIGTLSAAVVTVVYLALTIVASEGARATQLAKLDRITEREPPLPPWPTRNFLWLSACAPSWYDSGFDVTKEMMAWLVGAALKQPYRCARESAYESTPVLLSGSGSSVPLSGKEALAHLEAGGFVCQTGMRWRRAKVVMGFSPETKAQLDVFARFQTSANEERFVCFQSPVPADSWGWPALPLATALEDAPTNPIGVHTDAAAELRGLAIELDITPVSGFEMTEAEFDILTAVIRRRLTSQIVKIPLLDIEVRSTHVLYVLVLVTFALLVLMRNRLRYVFGDAEAGLGEPWLLVDPAVGIERFLANTWLLVLLIAPWVVGSASIAVDATFASYRNVGFLWWWGICRSTCMFLTTLVIMTATGKMSLNIVAGILQLRYRRRQLERRSQCPDIWSDGNGETNLV